MGWGFSGRSKAILFALLLVSSLGCKIHNGVPDSAHPKIKKLVAGKFPHELFDATLKKYNRGGYVDYASLSKDRALLDAYLAALSKINPQTHKELFPDRQHELAYWINAYNALIFQNVLTRSPFAGLHGKLSQSTFFAIEEFTLGGMELTLEDLEELVIRATYQDPRVHFALNCAALGCARLPEEAFVAEKLEDQLNRETRKFVLEERNVKIKVGRGQLLLTSIFKWHGDEFSTAPSVQNSGSDKSTRLIAWINKYRPKDRKIGKREGGWEIKFRDYDWSLNDRKNKANGSPGE